MKKTLYIFAALVAPTVALAQGDAKPITLQEAVEMGKHNAPSMIQARGTIRTNAASLKVARWAYNPLNNITLSYGSSTGGGGSYVDGILIPRPATTWNFSQGFGGAQMTLWDGGKKNSDVHTARASLDQSEINEVSAEFTLAQQIKQQYYNILLAREQEAAAQDQMAVANQQLTASITGVKTGTKVVSDTLNAALAIGNAQIALLNARNGLNNGNAQLTRLTGSNFPVTAVVADTADVPPLQITDAELYALAEQGPSVRSSMAQLTTSKAREKGARSVLWPTITAGGSFSRSNNQQSTGGFNGYDFGAGPMNYSWGFNLNASYTLFNGYARESSILSAKIAVDNADANLRDAKLTVRQNLTQQLGTLRTAEAQVQIQRQQIAIAQQSLLVAQKRYELGASGAGTLLDVLTAQNALNSAKTGLATQRFNVRNARAQIESLIGRDLPPQ